MNTTQSSEVSMKQAFKIENSRESARKPKGYKSKCKREYAAPRACAETGSSFSKENAQRTYEHASYAEWAILFFGLCFCFLILLTSSDTIRYISESDGVGAISSSLGHLISQNDAIAVFFGLEQQSQDNELSADSESHIIPTFSYTGTNSAQEYIDLHNAENYYRSGVSPTADGTISSGYSFRKNPFYLLYEGESAYEFHSGIDIAAEEGSNIRSYLDGTVDKCALSSSYGYYVVIDHGNGLKTLYAHASKLLCKEGDRVKKGETIALVGTTGRSTGPHVHFEVYKDGEVQDPQYYLPYAYKG